MKNKNIKYESDEKKSIIIALIVSVIVMIAIVLAYFAVKKYRTADSGSATQEETMESTQDTGGDSKDGNIVVATQEELDTALSDPETVSVLFQTEEEQHIVITDGDYSSIDFQIDAPLTNVDNYGVFSQVTIFRVASNTWTEKAVGNRFLIDSAACHMEIDGGALVNSIESIQDGSTLAIESDGTVKSVLLEAPSSIVSIQSDGALEQVKVYNNTSLNLMGSQTSVTDLEISYGADGTVLNTSIPVSISCFASATLSMDAGAEESTIAVNNSDAFVQVANHTTETIAMTSPDGTEQTLETEQTTSFGTDPSQTQAETVSSTGTQAASDSSGSVKSGSSASSGTSASPGRTNVSSGSGSTSGSSGTAKGGTTVTTTTTTGDSKTNTSGEYTKEQVNQIVSSAVKEATQGKIDQKTADTMIEEATKDMVSKDKMEDMIKDAVDDAVNQTLSKPMLVSFLDEAPIYVGVANSGATDQNTLPDVQSLPLPDHVIGRTYIGEQYHVPVLSWQNLDNYSASAKPGAYRFAAILQTSTEYNIISGARALMTVYVGSATNQGLITYKNRTYENLISISENDVENIQDTLIGDKISYYYITNQSQTEVLYVSLNFHYYDKQGRNIAENESRWSGRYLQPGESCIAYRENPYMEYEGYFVEIDASKSGLEAAERYCQVDLEYENQTSETATNQLELHVYKKNTRREISECSVTLLFYGADKRGNKIVIGVQTISTGRGETASINDTNENNPIIVDVEPPEGTTEMKYATVGGYAFLGLPDSTASTDAAEANGKTAEEAQK